VLDAVDVVEGNGWPGGTCQHCSYSSIGSLCVRTLAYMHGSIPTGLQLCVRTPSLPTTCGTAFPPYMRCNCHRCWRLLNAASYTMRDLPPAVHGSYLPYVACIFLRYIPLLHHFRMLPVVSCY